MVQRLQENIKKRDPAVEQIDGCEFFIADLKIGQFGQMECSLESSSQMISEEDAK